VRPAGRQTELRLERTWKCERGDRKRLCGVWGFRTRHKPAKGNCNRLNLALGKLASTDDGWHLVYSEI